MGKVDLISFLQEDNSQNPRHANIAKDRPMAVKQKLMAIKLGKTPAQDSRYRLQRQFFKRAPEFQTRGLEILEKLTGSYT